MRDSMRQRSYDWENDLFGLGLKTKKLEKHEVEPMVAKFEKLVLDRIERLYGVEKKASCAVTLRSGGRWARGGWMGVSLPPWSWNPEIIAHEVAHWAEKIEVQFRDYRMKDAADPGHGRHWLGWYIFLLAEGCGHQRIRMCRSASFYGLKIAPKDITTMDVLERLSKRKGLSAVA